MPDLLPLALIIYLYLGKPLIIYNYTPKPLEKYENLIKMQTLN